MKDFCVDFVDDRTVAPSVKTIFAQISNIYITYTVTYILFVRIYFLTFNMFHSCTKCTTNEPEAPVSTYKFLFLVSIQFV